MYMYAAFGCLYNSKHMRQRRGEHSWNDSGFLSGSLHMASHLLKLEITFYSLGAFRTLNHKEIIALSK